MRKETNKNHRFNLMDVIAILLALVCITSIVVRAISIEEPKVTAEVKKYRLYFQIDDIRSSSLAFFEGHEGESVRLKDDNTILGTLGAEFSRGVGIFTYTENVDGNLTDKKYYYPESVDDSFTSEERCSISGYIIVGGDMVDNVFWLNNQKILVPEQTLNIVTEHIEATIRITSIVTE